MTDLDEAERQRLILEISRRVDAFKEAFLTGEPDWGPLHDAVPLKHCDGFMWMYRTGQDGETIEHYKHGITRRYLHLDHHGHAYLYASPGYVETPVGIAVELVFADIGLLGATRETAYNEAYIRKKHRELRAMGWTVIS